MSAKKGPKKSPKKKRALNSKKSENSSESSTAGDISVGEHKHCVNCGVSIPPDRETCSEKCQAEWDKMLKRKKFWIYLPLIGALFLALLWIILSVS